MPELTVGPSVAMTFSSPRVFELQLGAVFWPEQTIATVHGRARFSMLGADARACVRWSEPRWLHFGPCAGVQLGWIHAEGRGFPLDSRSADRFAAAIAARFFARIESGPWFFGADVELGAPLLRDTFFYDDLAGTRYALHRLSPVVFGAGAELGVRFD
jgi:hypothetical protein